MNCVGCNGTGYVESDPECRECAMCDGTGKLCCACLETGDDCDCQDGDDSE
jgi:hypothetical protein